MRPSIAILFFLLFGFLPASGQNPPRILSLIWRNDAGRPVYEAIHRAQQPSKGAYLRGFRYGDSWHVCMAPEYVWHGPIKVRTYLRQPMLCHVPAGAKFCPQPAHVNHNGIYVLPYLYLDYPPFSYGPSCLLPWVDMPPLRPAIPQSGATFWIPVALPAR